MIDIIIMLVGIFSGILGTLLGLGGGTFTLPILIFILKFDIHTAISLSLVGIITKSILSTAINIKANYINLPLGLILTPTAIVGSTIGGRLGLNSSSRVLSLTFAITLLSAALLIYIYRKPKSVYYKEKKFNGQYIDKNSVVKYTPVLLICGIITSTVGGFLGGIVGIGGGGILVPIMRIINRIPMKAAATTSLFIMGFSAIPPALLYYSKNVLNPRYAIFIIIGSFIGAILGNVIIKKLNDKFISKMFSMVLLIIACSMIFNAFK